MSEELALPSFREGKPRSKGITIIIDNGVPTQYFKDVISSHTDYIDMVKFGWGTCLVTKDLEQKIACLQEHNVDYFFGGTLFERCLLRKELDKFYNYCKKHQCKFMEISNGTIDLTNKEKAQHIKDFSKDFQILSEVGLKDNEKSESMHPALWIEYILQDLEAGSFKVITEARESGQSGICRKSGEVRHGLINEILSIDRINAEDLVFETPNKPLQVYFIQKLGANVNLCNIALQDVIALETLRLGLRSDTLKLFGELA